MTNKCSWMGTGKRISVVCLPVLLIGLLAPVRESVAAIAFVQAAAYSPVVPETSAAATYANAQVAGDTNIVAISWQSSTGSVSSITDTMGNAYSIAIGPTLYSGIASETIYYASNIKAAAAGANTITVTFSGSLANPDLRIAEYSGVATTSPVDVAVGAIGTSTSMSSGSVTTTNANDLLIGANVVANSTTGAGTGYTSRLLTSHADIFEDEIVTATGSYSATAPEDTAGWWIMQMVAFKASSGNTAPNPPTGLGGTPVSSSQINLTWADSTSSGVSANLIERCSGPGCSNFSQIASLAATATTYNDTGLTATTSYSYRIRATTSGGLYSTYTSTFTVSTLAGGAIGFAQATATSPLVAVSSLAATYPSAQTAGDTNIVAISWQSSTGSVSSITDTVGNAYSIAIGPTIDSGLASQTIYYATNILGAAAGTNTVTVVLSGSLSNPDLRIAEYGGISATNPVDVTVGASGSSTAINSGSVTTTNANDLLIGADVVANSTTGPGTGYTQRLLTTHADIFEDEIVTATGNYAATAPQDKSGWWVMQMAAFKNAGSGGSAPNPPTGLGGSAASSSQINLTWTDSTSSGVVANLIERCSGTGCTNFSQISSAAATATTYSDTGLTPATSYSYRIRASNAAGLYSTYTTTFTVSTAAGLAAPTGFSGSVVSSAQINLAWTDSVSAGVTANLIERCAGAGCTAFAQTASVAATATTYSDTGLTGSTSYSYRLRVTNAAGQFSGYTSTVTASTTAAQAPTSPTPAMAAAASSSQISLKWAASTDPVGVTAYLIESCTGAGCTNFTQIASVAGTVTTYTVSGLAGGSSYSYRVRASDAAGLYSGYSPVVSASTPTGSGISGSVSYGYDALGRLVEMATPTLNSVQGMAYDPAGNITANTATAISVLSIDSLSASQVSVGQQITIDGAGFSTTPSSNTVTINGIAATPVSATASQIVVTVPSGATSGPVKVTVGGVLVTSTQSLAIVSSLGTPTVTGFSPAGGPPGTVITISGTNFSTAASRDKVLINGTPAVVTAATATSLTVTIPSDVASGPVQVVTPSGLATSATTLIVPPSGYTLTNISWGATVAKNGSGVAVGASAGNPALVFFSGTEGDTLDKVVAVGGGGTWYVLDPHGFPIATSSVSGAYFLPTLDVTGTYTVEIIPAASGTYSVYLTTPQTGTANLTWGQETAPTPAIYTNESGVNPAAPTQQVDLSFTGAVGQLTEVDILHIAGTWTLSLVNSVGTTLWTSASFAAATTVTLPALPADGSYTLVFDPGIGTGSLNYNAGIIPSGSLAYGSDINVNGGGPTFIGEGPTARVAFSGTAGQAVTLSVGATRGFFYGLNVYYLQGSSQICLISCGSGNSGGIESTSYISLPYTGTYIAYLYFASSYPSSADLRLSSTIPLSIGASATTVNVGASTTTGLFTNVFTFTAGNQSVTFHDSCSTYWALLNSSGTVVNANGSQSGAWSLGTLTSGSYRLITGLQGSTSVGSSAALYGVGSSGDWPTTTTTCTLQLTSP